MEDETLEQQGDSKEPNLPLIIDELQQAAVDANQYMRRVGQASRWWHCEWDNQFIDGRRWADNPSQADKIFPWNGCSDSRLRIVDTIVREHVTLSLVAFWSAKVQAKSIRPFESARQVSVTQRMLNWRIYTHMKRELLDELDRGFSWKYACGLAFLGITWEQQRELSYVPITLDIIGQLTAQLGLGDVMDKILDPDKAYDQELVVVMQSLSPVLPTGEARTILNDLRTKGTAELPVVGLRINKPRWLAKRPLIDVLFPSKTSDIQQARFTSERELVSEAELIDRIETDGYDPDFVDEALAHKGVFSDWALKSSYTVEHGSDRDLIELHHFLARQIRYDTPCMYRTVFNESVASKQLYAVHRKFEYDHQQYPLVALRRTHTYRPLLSSIGIAEESYTDEMDLKRQQDGLNDRTELIHQPPMIVPTLRAQAQSHSYGPRAVMTAMRPEGIVFPNLPPMDQTPVIVIQMIEQRLDRRYAIIGGAIDPEIKAVRRQQLATQDLGELELALEQTLQLMQQFETDDDVQRVAGGGQPWQYGKKDIQGQYEITATVDMKMIDLEYAQMKMDMLAKLLPFREQGMVFNAAANIIDPDLADALSEDQASPAAMQKEQDAEYNAMSQIMSGIEPVKPITAMNNVRLQTIQQIMSQPQVAQKVMGDPVSQKLLQNRIKFFTDQIQQYQANPQIGRTLATQTFAPNQPAAVSNVPASQ